MRHVTKALERLFCLRLTMVRFRTILSKYDFVPLFSIINGGILYECSIFCFSQTS